MLKPGSLALKGNLSGKVKKEVKAITKDALDGFQLGATATLKMNQVRREMMKFDFHSSFRGLCKALDHESTMVFGDDLAESVKVFSQSQNLGSQVTKREGQRNNKSGRRFSARVACGRTNEIATVGRSSIANLPAKLPATSEAGTTTKEEFKGERGPVCCY